MFEPIESNEAVYKKVVAQIQEMILHGELKKGDRLPPERQLAETLQVGRPALKQALSALEVLGLIRSRQGDGNYIASDSLDVFNPLALRFYLEHGNDEDILEFRYIMEVQMASLAAVKITDEQQKEFDALMERIKPIGNETLPLSTRVKYNNEFHFFIVNICGNRLIQAIYASIMDLISEQMQFTDGVNFYESHYRIYDAIRNGDSVMAARAMAEHFQNKFPNYRHYLDIQNIPVK